MAEIKSSIELAMEKTKNLVMDDHERRLLENREMEAKIRAVLRRYQESMIGSEEVARELAALQGDDTLTRYLSLDLLVQDFDVKKDSGRFWDLFELLSGHMNVSLRDEVVELRKALHREIEKREESIRDQIAKRLKAMGITGDGVEANLESWGEWREGIEETGTVFRNRLREWKEKLKAPRNQM
jgi:hypothetical protein